ncbi:hypothetical protein PG984_002636 [Apiospora sp. TS-2023a]
MDVVHRFVDRYDQERGQWEQLKNCAIAICIDGLKQIDVLANVTGRAKSASSLGKKLESRHAQNAYQDEESIMQDQLDFVGLRIALYFPQQKQQVIKMINEKFQHQTMRPFNRDWKPDEPGIYQHLFGQYVADHVWVCLLEQDRSGAGVYAAHKFEIQLRSVLMDAWSGISHDIEYKALSGTPSITELKLLDALKGHVEVGEIMLEQLYSTHRKRIETEKQAISSPRELCEILFDFVPKSQLAEAELGDLGALLSVLRGTGMNTPRRFVDLLRAYESPKKLRADLLQFKREFDPLPATVAFCLLEKVLPDTKTEKAQFSELISAVRLNQHREWYDSPYWQSLLWLSRKLVLQPEQWLTKAHVRIYVHVWCAEYVPRSLRHVRYRYDTDCILDCLSKTTDHRVPGLEMFAALCMLGLGPEIARYAEEHDEPDYEDDRFCLAANTMCTTYAAHPDAWKEALHDHAATLQLHSSVDIYQFLHSSDIALWLASFNESELLASLLMHWPLKGQPFDQPKPCLQRILECAENRQDYEIVRLLKEDDRGFCVLDERLLSVIAS